VATPASGGERSHLAGGLAGRIDKGVSYALLGRVWSVGANAVTVVLVINLFSPTLQGYFYGFASLLVLQQLMQTGLGYVLLQFVSHEWPLVRMIASSSLDGDQRALSRLSSLVRLAQRAFGYIAVGVLGLLLVAGVALFGGRSDAGVEWAMPWVALCFATAGSVFFLLPMSTALEGSGNVGAQQRALFGAGIAGNIAGWAFMLMGFGLFALAIQTAVRTIVGALLMIGPYRPFRRLGREVVDARDAIRWSDVWPLQWRITLSFLFGLMTYQLLVPLAFHFQGPVIAGQLGLQFQAYLAIGSVASIWLVSAQPRMGALASLGDRRGLAQLTRRTAIRCLLTAIPPAAVGVGLVGALGIAAPSIGERFGDVRSLALLARVAAVSQPVAAMVSAVRFRKREPFVIPIAVCSFLSVVSVAIAAATLPPIWMVIAFSATILGIVVPWQTLIYRREMARDDAAGGPDSATIPAESVGGLAGE
jgi:hypothetical protein